MSEVQKHEKESAVKQAEKGQLSGNLQAVVVENSAKK
jgi:hypothetical protein